MAVVAILAGVPLGGIDASRNVLALRPGLPDRPGALAAADFNADGTLDLLQANFASGDLSLFEEDASGKYIERAPSPFLVVDGPVFLGVADLNKDGRPDVVSVNT